MIRRGRRTLEHTINLVVSGNINITINQGTESKIIETNKTANCTVNRKDVIWSSKMVDSIMAEKQLLNKAWHYETGVMLKTMERLWEKTKEQKYLDYIKANIDHWVNEDGSINTYNQEEYRLDDVTPGRVLLFLYRQTKAEKYLRAAQLLREHLRKQPRTQEGGFWHKEIYAQQMWLDGLFMACPFYAEYGGMFNEPENYDDIVKQFLLIASHTKDEATGLYRHGWFDINRQDKSLKAPVWVDETGKAPCIWGRAVGWYVVAMVEVLDYLPEKHPQRGELLILLKDLLAAIVAAQDVKTGLWYQVMDKPEAPGNYLESSCSAMFVYALAKSVRKGYIDDVYLHTTKKAYLGMLEHFINIDDKGNAQFTQICQMASLGPGSDGSYEYYVRQPKVANDSKGSGPFVMASMEIEMAEFE